MSDIKLSGQAVIEDGDIVIRVAIVALPTIVDGVEALWDELGNAGFSVTDPSVFAAEVVRVLNDEDEHPIHSMFDAAIERATFDGAEGIDGKPRATPLQRSEPGDRSERREP